MPNDETELLLAFIGEILESDTRYPIENTLLYAEVEPGMVSASVFKDDGTSAVYRWVYSDRLIEALQDLWDAADPEKRWAEMEYVIRNNSFHAHFTFADEIDKDEDEFERRARIVKRYFGDKPIAYPSWPPPSPPCREFEP
ncbi:hypothetical protein [Sphingomonas sp.]|uniref:hypothetical protein n=1 Tax=Sphingomonas sp. TaxID=28214 RepID=UPI000DB3198F|nr:hypothetical protein [Sphingomonas sp.]PZU11610.1 MAG: hypothetical protein DI605_01065 [Sphingomonas sp.]